MQYCLQNTRTPRALLSNRASQNELLKWSYVVFVCIGFVLCVPIPHSARCPTNTLNHPMIIKCFKTTQPQTKPNSYPDTHYLPHLKHTGTHTQPKTTSFFNRVCVLHCNCIKLGFDWSCLEKDKGLPIAGPSPLRSDWPAGRHCRVVYTLDFTSW